MKGMFVLGTLGLGLLYLLSSLMLVIAIGSLYGVVAAQISAVACSVFGVLAGVIIGALLAGGLKHPLQSQLEELVSEAANRRRAVTREAPYAREKNAPTYGDEGVPVAAGPPHDHMAPWEPQALPTTKTPASSYEAPSFAAPQDAGSPGRRAKERARQIVGQVKAPVAQMRQRVQAGDLDGAIEVGRQALEKTYESTQLDELYAELPGLLATYRSGGGRAALGQLSDRAREIASASSGQTQADAQQLGDLFGRLETLSPSDVPVATWIKILGGVKQMRTNPRGFIKTVTEALGDDGAARA